MLPFLLLMAESCMTQDYNTYKASDAEMVQVNGTDHTSSILKGTVISLSNSSNLLMIRLRIPNQSINYIPADDSMSSSPGLPGVLKMTINPSQVQDELTSEKVFKAQAFLTLNNITKAVMVEYKPLPAGPDQDGDFNLTMTIQFNAGDFNLGDKNKNALYIIKIGNATVNRI